MPQGIRILNVSQFFAEIDDRRKIGTHQDPPCKSRMGYLRALSQASLVLGGQRGIEDAIGDAGYADHFGYIVDADNVDALQDASGDGGSGAPDF